MRSALVIGKLPKQQQRFQVCVDVVALVCGVGVVLRAPVDKSKPGDFIWSYTKAEFLKMLKEPLQDTGVIGSDVMKLKAFRAGKA